MLYKAPQFNLFCLPNTEYLSHSFIPHRTVPSPADTGGDRVGITKEFYFFFLDFWHCQTTLSIKYRVDIW